MAAHCFLSGFFALVVVSVCASAFDPSPLQDFCVAERNSSVLVNGKTCKDPKLVQADDFSFSGLHIPGNTSNSFGFCATLVFETEMAGLNTLGMSMARNDLAVGGVNTPHIHPRASEMITVLQGTMLVGVVTSNPENRLITKVLQKGDVFVFPMGLVHFNQNIGNCNVVSLVFFNSQNPGATRVGSAIFASKPEISSTLLAKSFQVAEDVIVKLQSKSYD